MDIIWSNKARDTYSQIIDQLLENWNPDIAEDFETKTNNLLDNLKEFKKLCPPSKKKRLRKCIIHKKNALVYRLKKNSIEIVTFINNQANHKY